jgi:hypothetical protein
MLSSGTGFEHFQLVHSLLYQNGMWHSPWLANWVLGLYSPYAVLHEIIAQMMLTLACLQHNLALVLSILEAF